MCAFPSWLPRRRDFFREGGARRKPSRFRTRVVVVAVHQFSSCRYLPRRRDRSGSCLHDRPGLHIRAAPLTFCGRLFCLLPALRRSCGQSNSPRITAVGAACRNETLAMARSGNFLQSVCCWHPDCSSDHSRCVACLFWHLMRRRRRSLGRS